MTLRRLLPWLHRRARDRSLLAAAAGALLLLGACSLRYGEGQALEAEGRWEEAMLAYRDAVVDFPKDTEYRDALQRAEKVVARDNFERYKAFLAQKAFRKAYLRLQDAARQDPDYAPVREEEAKWQRVLVGGQVTFRFDTAQSNISLADEINLVVRINTPNPGETVDAQVDINSGIFFTEDLLYDRPAELLTLYTINAIGVETVFGRTRIKQFTSREFYRFINLRTPIADDVSGVLDLNGAQRRTPVAAHRAALPLVPVDAEAEVPAANPHYALTLSGQRIYVSTPDSTGRSDYTPRYLYVNREERRVFVDFGHYEVRLPGPGQRWTLRRLSMGEQDYFTAFSRNIALKPYFFYREGVFAYLPVRSR